jgi:transposase
MNTQKRLNAFTRGRLFELVRDEDYSVKQVCKVFDISRQTYYKWFHRENLNDKKPIPLNPHRKTPKWLERLVIKIRDKVGLSSIKIHYLLKNQSIINPSTNKTLSEYAIRQIFKRYKRGYKFDKLKLKKTIIRYEKTYPGEMAHIDVKQIRKLKCETHKVYEALLIDDFTRISYVQIIPDKTAKTLSFFLKNAVKFFQNEYNIKFSSLLSDNGNEFTSRYKKNLELHSFEAMCSVLSIKHRYTKLYRPQTNGKAERMWRTIDIEFYKKHRFFSPEQREKALTLWLKTYNNTRIHLGIKGQSPLRKLQKFLKAA